VWAWICSSSGSDSGRAGALAASTFPGSPVHVRDHADLRLLPFWLGKRAGTATRGRGSCRRRPPGSDQMPRRSG
jgi:hypothetical protein